MASSHEVLRRVGVGVVALPVVGLVLWQGGAFCAGLFALAAGLGAWEYLRLALPERPAVAWIGVAAAAVLPIWPLVAPSVAGAGAFATLGAASMLTWVMLLARGPRPEAPTRAGHVLAAVLFAAAGLFALAALRARGDGFAWTVAVLAATWANDTAAFFGGRALGRHKLWPAVSPGKTWEGLIAGALGGAACAFALRLVLPLTVADAAALAAIVATFGPVGDLCKSMLKRAYHVKDTGRLFPGHGGMLDRIDAVLFNAPLTLAYLALRA